MRVSTHMHTHSYTHVYMTHTHKISKRKNKWKNPFCSNFFRNLKHQYCWCSNCASYYKLSLLFLTSPTLMVFWNSFIGILTLKIFSDWVGITSQSHRHLSSSLVPSNWTCKVFPFNRHLSFGWKWSTCCFPKVPLITGGLDLSKRNITGDLQMVKHEE